MLGLFGKPWTPKYQKLLRAWCGTDVLVSPKFRLYLIVWALLYEFTFGWLIKHSNQSINLSYYNLPQHSTHGGLYRPSYVYFNLLDVSLCDLSYFCYSELWTTLDLHQLNLNGGLNAVWNQMMETYVKTYFVSYTRTFGICFCTIWY